MKKKLYIVLLLLALAALAACAAKATGSLIETTTVPDSESSVESSPAPVLEETAETLPNTGATDDENSTNASAVLDSPETDGEASSAETTPPVLMRTGSFTGLTPLRVERDYYGGYLYADQTADGMTVIYNCCLAGTPGTDETAEDYVGTTLETVAGAAPEQLTVTQNADHSARLGYPVYLLTWQTNGGEQVWDGFFLVTNAYTYLYAFCTSPDNAAAMAETWQSVFSELYLFDPTTA